MPEAVAAGLFGVEETGPMIPDDADVAALTYEHACEMQVLLTDVVYLSHCRRLGMTPESGRVPRDRERSAALQHRLDAAVRDAAGRYQDCLDAYERAFGQDAALELDQHVRAAAPSFSPPAQ